MRAESRERCRSASRCRGTEVTRSQLSSSTSDLTFDLSCRSESAVPQSSASGMSTRENFIRRPN